MFININHLILKINLPHRKHCILVSAFRHSVVHSKSCRRAHNKSNRPAIHRKPNTESILDAISSENRQKIIIVIIQINCPRNFQILHTWSLNLGAITVNSPCPIRSVHLVQAVVVDASLT